MFIQLQVIQQSDLPLGSQIIGLLFYIIPRKDNVAEDILSRNPSGPGGEEHFVSTTAEKVWRKTLLTHPILCTITAISEKLAEEENQVTEERGRRFKMRNQLILTKGRKENTYSRDRKGE